MQTLLGAEKLSVRRLAISWAGFGGWVLGSTFYLCFARQEPGLLVLGLPVALLSAIAVARATRVESDDPWVIVGYSTLASLVCPLVTILPVMIVDGLTSTTGFLGAALGGAAAGVVSGFFAIPLGIFFGFIYASVWRLLDGARRFGHAAPDVARIRFGLAFMGLAAFLFVVDSLLPNSLLIERPGETNVLSWLAFGTFVFGVLASLFGLLRYLGRYRLARRVRRGEIDGWAFVPIETVPEAAALPRLFLHGKSTTVLVRRCAATGGPFRSSEPSEPIARF